MRRFISAAVLAVVGGCGSDDAQPKPAAVDPSGFPADDPSQSGTEALSVSMARGLTISEVALYQSVKVGLARDGKPADRTIAGSTGSELPIVAGRGAMLRVFVKPSASWTAAAVTARVKVQLVGPAGTQTGVFYTTKTVATAASTDSDLSSTLNVELPGDALRPGAQVGVVLSQAGGAAATPDDESRYPRDGSLAPLGVSGGGEVVKILLVPMVYTVDGSGRLPDTSDAQIKIYRDRFYRLYPAVSFDITVREAVSFGKTISASGAGFDLALNAIGTLRGTDGAPSDLYYYGLFEPRDAFGTFCSGGCVTGLSSVGTPMSVGVGYPGEGSAGTAVHEIGHAHGLNHAPFCGAQGPGNYWPTDPSHAGAHLGAWGYDALDKKLIDPAKFTDLMSYCGSSWISDFHYQRLFATIKGNNKFFANLHGPVAPEGAQAYRALWLGIDGESATWAEASTAQSWITRGSARTVEVHAADGSATLHTAYYFPYDHLPGGSLMIPEVALATARSVRIAERDRDIAVRLR